MDTDFFRELNIIQVYISKNENHNLENYFKSKLNLQNYSNINLSSLFVGIHNDNDIEKINNHRGYYYFILFQEKFLDTLKTKAINILKNKKVKNIFLSNKNKILFENSEINNKCIFFENSDALDYLFIPKITIVIQEKCLAYVYNMMYNFLKKIGWNVNTTHNNNILESLDVYKNALHHYFLIFMPFYIDKTFYEKTNNYFIYQFEQHNNMKLNSFYNEIYEKGLLLKYYQNAKLTIDYTKINISTIKNILGIEPKYLPPPINSELLDLTLSEKTNNIIFLGRSNKRRRKILNEVKKKYKIYVPEKNLYDDEFRDLLKKSRILLNIHFYDFPILERLRLNEALLTGIRIISEKPCEQDMEICENYKDVVDFIEIIDDNYNCKELNNCIKRVWGEIFDPVFCEKRNIKLKNTINKLENEFIDKLDSLFNIK
jgi:hypothetical protein